MIIKPKKYHRYTYRRNTQRPKWLLWAGILLGCVMIVLPAVVVMLPIGSNDESQSAPEDNESVPALTEDEDVLDVQVQRTATDEVEEVPLEQYVASVVASEMPVDFEEEALKAQAVAARTYIVHHLQQQDEDDSVIKDTTEHQVYKSDDELKEGWGEDYHWKMDKVSTAVLATEGEIITYDEEPITPTFFSMSNGYTEDAENYWGNALPYLKSVESKWEEAHPDFEEQNVFTFGELQEKLGVSLHEGGDIALSLSRTDSNRVNELQINDTTFSGKEIREKLALRSSDFSIEQYPDHFVFTTKGFGHGVGMSQHGANGMAEEGRSYEDILHHYYQDVDIDSISDAVPTLVSK